jgi:hypothetical protein
MYEREGILMDEDFRRWVKIAANFCIQVIRPMLKRKEIEIIYVDGELPCIIRGPNFFKNHPEYKEYDENYK